MTLIFAYLAGLLTLINPCVLPVLPIVLATALQAHRLGPVALALGMTLSFVALGVGLAALGPAIGLTPEAVAQAGAIVMIAFGLTLLIPRLGDAFAKLTARLSTQADQRIDQTNRQSLWGQAVGGALLGAVWSPCVGPTLGGAISLASQGQSLTFATLTMTAFAAGVSTVILSLAYTTRSLLTRSRATLRALATTGRPILGAVFALTGLFLFFNLNRPVEAWLIDHLPTSLQDLSVSL